MPVFNALVWGEPLIQDCEIWPQELETFLCHMVQKVFLYIEPFWHDSQV